MLKNNLSSARYYIKPVLSSNWTNVKYLSDTKDTISILIEDDGLFLEKSDKILYAVKSVENECFTYTTTVLDIDFPSYNKIVLTIEKTFERRIHSRFGLYVSATLNTTSSSFKCTLVEISRGGAKLLSENKLNARESVDVTILLNDSDTLSFEAKIVHISHNNSILDTNNFSYGLKITSIDKYNSILLNDLISSLEEKLE